MQYQVDPMHQLKKMAQNNLDYSKEQKLAYAWYKKIGIS